MYLLKSRREREQETVYTMIRMYCKAHHQGQPLCEDCNSLWEYARIRNARCIFGEDKPVCNACKVHCYKPDRREEIRKVMRFAGPRMILAHPLMALDHLLMGLKPHPKTVPVPKPGKDKHKLY